MEENKPKKKYVRKKKDYTYVLPDYEKKTLTKAEKERIEILKLRGTLNTTQLAELFGKSRHTIYLILNPDKYQKKLENNRKHDWRKYYNKEKFVERDRNYRRRVSKLKKEGLAVKKPRNIVEKSEQV